MLFLSIENLLYWSLHVAQFVSWLVSEVGALWKVRDAITPGATEEEEYWTPWAHIYPHSKATLTNISGKYFVKLFWMVSLQTHCTIDF